MNSHTGRFAAPGVAVPENESQGAFAFGSACARAVIAAGGNIKRIRKGKRL